MGAPPAKAGSTESPSACHCSGQELQECHPTQLLNSAHPQAQLTLFVDDVVVAADGKKESEVRAVMVDTCADVLQAIEVELAASYVAEKSVVIASSEQLAASIQRDLQLPAATVAASFGGAKRLPPVRGLPSLGDPSLGAELPRPRRAWQVFERWRERRAW